LALQWSDSNREIGSGTQTNVNLRCFGVMELKSEKSPHLDLAVRFADAGVRSRQGPAIHCRRLWQGPGASEAAEPADIRRVLGAMVIHLPPDASHVGAGRPRQVRRTVCLAGAQLRQSGESRVSDEVRSQRHTYVLRGR